MAEHVCKYCGQPAAEKFDIPVEGDSSGGQGPRTIEVWFCTEHANGYRRLQEQRRQQAEAAEQPADEAPAEPQPPEPAPVGALARRQRRSLIDRLNGIAVDLTDLAAKSQLKPVIGRDTEIDRLILVLSRYEKCNAALIGEPGVGKTAVVEGLAQRIVQGQVPERLKNWKLLSVSIASLVAGSVFRGQFEEKLQALCAIAAHAKCILFFDEMHMLVGAGDAAGGAADASQILKPYLARRSFPVIGATTSAEFKKIERDGALARRFEAIEIKEPTAEQAVAILRQLKPKYEEHHQVEISDEACEAAVRYAITHIHNRRLPDKAVDLLDKAAAWLRIRTDRETPTPEQVEAQIAALTAQREEAVRAADFATATRLEMRLMRQRRQMEENPEPTKPVLCEQDIVTMVSQQTGIPAGSLTESEQTKLRRLEETLNSRVIGQEQAVHAVVRAVKRARLNGGERVQPQGRFFLYGPTGTGKTHLARTLAETLFDTREALIQINMSEYSEPHSKARLIGSPPGYVGHESGGQLTNAVKRHPHCVLLFDEVEKAHPQVHELLLQVLEEGKLTDGLGETVDFRHTIVLFTSNIGQAHLQRTQRRIGFTSTAADEVAAEAEVRRDAEKDLQRIMAPEFLNRMDDIIVFNSLTPENMAQIAALRLREIADLYRKLHSIELLWREEVCAYLGTLGYSDLYGARNLNRAIQREVEDRLNDALLDGAIAAGQQVGIELNDGEIQLVLIAPDETEEPAPSPATKPASATA